MAKKINYSDALGELEEIVENIESNEIDVDQLSEKVKRASELLKLCKSKLRKTEEEVEKILEDMNSED